MKLTGEQIRELIKWLDGFKTDLMIESGFAPLDDDVNDVPMTRTEERATCEILDLDDPNA